MLKDKVALVTGASQGFGLAMAQEFAREGAVVVLVNRTPEKGAEAAEQITSQGGRAVAMPADVSQMEQVRGLMEQVRQQFGRLDILVNNAGVIRPAMLPKLSLEAWDQVLRINLTGYFICLHCAAPIMIEQKYGRVLNISSVAGSRGTIGQANYAAAKAGVHGLTKSAAKELARYGVTVNAVAAGLFETAMSDRMPPELKQKAIAEIPLGRMGQVWELAKLAAFLVSDNAAYLTGQIIGLNGGIYM